MCSIVHVAMIQYQGSNASCIDIVSFDVGVHLLACWLGCVCMALAMAMITTSNSMMAATMIATLATIMVIVVVIIKMLVTGLGLALARTCTLPPLDIQKAFPLAMLRPKTGHE